MNLTEVKVQALRDQLCAALAAAEADRAAVHAANETLNRERRALLERAEAAEAALTAVPVEALRQLRTHLSDDGDYSITRTDREQMWIGDSLVLGSLFEKIDAWLAWQSEVQP